MDTILNHITNKDHLFFLNSYFKYNQISTISKNKDKKTFIIKLGIFAFEVIDFSF